LHIASIQDHQYRILICTDFHYAVVPTKLDRHLRTHRIRLSLPQCRAIVSTIDGFSGLARTPSDVVYPSPSDPPVAHLSVHFDGLQCGGSDTQGAPCSYICRTRRGIREHCEQRHNWVNSHKRGGDTRSKQTQSKNVESSAYVFDTVRIQISLWL
jgi:hypothetical protein